MSIHVFVQGKSCSFLLFGFLDFSFLSIFRSIFSCSLLASIRLSLGVGPFILGEIQRVIGLQWLATT